MKWLTYPCYYPSICAMHPLTSPRSALSPPPASAGPRRQRPGRQRCQGRGGARHARRRPRWGRVGKNVLKHGEVRVFIVGR